MKHKLKAQLTYQRPQFTITSHSCCQERGFIRAFTLKTCCLLLEMAIKPKQWAEWSKTVHRAKRNCEVGWWLSLSSSAQATIFLWHVLIWSIVTFCTCADFVQLEVIILTQKHRLGANQRHTGPASYTAQQSKVTDVNFVDFQPVCVVTNRAVVVDSCRCRKLWRREPCDQTRVSGGINKILLRSGRIYWLAWWRH